MSGFTPAKDADTSKAKGFRFKNRVFQAIKGQRGTTAGIYGALVSETMRASKSTSISKVQVEIE